MSLNLIQKNAIHFIDGPCFILAGAGSGKTKVIINKIIHLIHNCQYKPDSIIAVTFTNKAAHEIKTRLAQYLDLLQIKSMIISTFHALGLEIIKKEIKSCNFNENFSLLDEKDQIVLLKTIINEKLEFNKKFLKKVMFMISYWKNKFWTPQKVELLAQSTIEKNFSWIYKKYDSYLRISNVLDFDDLICIPVLLLKNNKKIRTYWRDKIAYLLVDEYQDTNNSQYALLKNLTNNNSHFTLVGDDDQSIYSWRGAKLDNILSLKKDYPNLKIIKMEQNYRSSGRILKVANSLISNNINNFQKKLFSKLDYGNRITVIIGDNEEKEAEKIADKIIYTKKIDQIDYNDYAVLYRSNYQSIILEKVFIKKNIPYHISGNTSFFLRPEIKDLIAYLRIIINPHDDYAFMRIINIPSRQIGLITLNKLKNIAYQEKKSLFLISKEIKKYSLFTKNTIKKINIFVIWIEKITTICFLQPIIAIDTIIDEIQYKLWLSKTIKESDKLNKSIKNISILSNWISGLLSGNDLEPPMTLSQIITKMTLRDITENNKEKNLDNKVQLMTLHASKGLEFLSVFIIGMIEGILPNYRSINDNNIQEERRLTYVGITRAKKNLFFSLCRKRIEYGKILNSEPSRFLFELPQEDLYLENNMILSKNYNFLDNKKYRINNFKKLLYNFKKNS
ncbi:UvrD-helicase domain-containing protein [Buchnera aphidicola]|uniref:UvrD-helicase domain-containing protein n=1 Tax=Buchnera aphidicola TaxID=9 RepID=UPI003BEF06E3